MAPKKSKIKLIVKENKNINISGKKTKKKSIKTSTKTINKTESLNKLYQLLDKNSKIFDDSLVNPNIKMDELYQKMDDVENIKKSIALKEEFKMYPSIYHPQFSKLIAERDLFSLYSIPDKKDEVETLFSKKTTIQDLKNIHKTINKRDIFKLSFNQQFLKNFMSPSSHYRGLLIFHGTGKV